MLFVSITKGLLCLLIWLQRVSKPVRLHNQRVVKQSLLNDCFLTSTVRAGRHYYLDSQQTSFHKSNAANQTFYGSLGKGGTQTNAQIRILRRKKEEFRCNLFFAILRSLLMYYVHFNVINHPKNHHIVQKIGHSAFRPTSPQSSLCPCLATPSEPPGRKEVQPARRAVPYEAAL